MELKQRCAPRAYLDAEPLLIVLNGIETGDEALHRELRLLLIVLNGIETT